jgi:hypothetical protein
MCAIAWLFPLSLVASVVTPLSHLLRLACAGLAPLFPSPCLAGTVVISAPPPLPYTYLLAIATYISPLHWMHPFLTFSPTRRQGRNTPLASTMPKPILTPLSYVPCLALWSTKTLALLSLVHHLNNTFFASPLFFMDAVLNTDYIISIHVDCCVLISFLNSLSGMDGCDRPLLN